MFGGRKKPPPRPPQDRSGGKSLAQLGLMDMGDDSDGGDGVDADLEDELNKLMFGGSKTSKPKKSRAQPAPDLERMVASCMADIPSDAEDDDIADDDDLLNELSELGADNDEPETYAVPRQPSPAMAHCNDGGTCAGQDLLSVIESRITMYTSAEQKAKAAGESAKARRFSRALATLTDQRKKIKSGKAVVVDDIPPAISLPSATPSAETQVTVTLEPSPRPPAPQPPTRVAPPPPLPARSAPQPPTQQSETTQPPTPPVEPPPAITVTTDVSLDPETIQKISQLKEKRDHYKAAALTAKQEGDKVRAVSGLMGVKQCDSMIKAALSGQSVELSELPDLQAKQPGIQQAAMQQNSEPISNLPNLVRTFSRDDPIQMPDNPEDIPPPDPSLFGAPPPPATVEEALQQRLAKYREDEAKAKQEGNSSRARRIGRICTQYVDALKLHKSGKPIPIDDLPSPPGFGPIPDPRAAAAATTLAASPAAPVRGGTMSSQSSGSSIAAGSKRPAPSPQPTSPAQTASLTASPADAEKPKRKSMSLQEKQQLLLEKRQTQFKEAALEAKRSGQIEQAKEYLRQAKGFDKLIEASKCGLPVDISSLPVAPQDTKDVSTGFVIVSTEDCDSEAIAAGTDRTEMFSKLEKDLIAQMKMCDTNRLHFKSTADVASSNKFQQMLEHTKKDLDALRFTFKRGDPVPKFHYEVRAFSRVVCNTDLTDNDLEFSIIQGINYTGANPKEMQTYCRFEFPYPKETPFKDRTVLVKDTNNPEYNHVSIIPLNRKEKSCQRIFKRNVAKVEVWLKGGFLRSDSLLGTAQIKLQSLETSCELHDSFALMDGRKAVGGQVEVKIRMRNPIVTKQIEKVEEKWLVISFG